MYYIINKTSEKIVYKSFIKEEIKQYLERVNLNNYMVLAEAAEPTRSTFQMNWKDEPVVITKSDNYIPSRPQPFPNWNVHCNTGAPYWVRHAPYLKVDLLYDNGDKSIYRNSNFVNWTSPNIKSWRFSDEF